MLGDKRFNVRVYGIWMLDGQVLINEEIINGAKVTKFPGGGLEWGEGTVDCLKREWKEELELEIDVLDHFYTTDYFQPSAFDDTQVISIYYWVQSAADPNNITNLQEGDKTYWLPVAGISGNSFTFPIDRKVGDMLYQLFGLSK